jgi:citrate lyase subunit beta/citryl-CoA lyase
MASIGMRSLTVGGQPDGYPFDAHHYPLMRILVAAKARGLQAIDGPYAKIHDADGLRAAAASVAALGYDGKWVLHPAQVDIVNEAFTPGPQDYERARRILEAYERATLDERRGAVMLDGEMIDEASRKLALAIVAKGDAAGR